MSEHTWGWKRKQDGVIILPFEARKTIEDLFAHSSFKLPVREVDTHEPIRVKYDVASRKWIEDIEDEKDRLWRTVVAASSR
jgi:hypothetical protein